ncbi:MAG: class I SAM-dependent methyltransferase [Vicinamibacterales bacterium]
MADTPLTPTDRPAGVDAYLRMEKAHYAALVGRSAYGDEAFATRDDDELVVGSYVSHEAYDYERFLIGGLSRKPGAVALDYGCGPGRMVKRMARHFSRVDGVDISPDVIAVAARRCADIQPAPRFFVTPGDSVPTAAGNDYDFAFSVICLQHICVYSIRRRILASLFEALKPGGVLSFQMGYGPGHPNMVDYEQDFVDANATNGVIDAGVLHPGEIAADLQSIGFTRMAFALTPAGPGDKHGAWIFVRAVKPGQEALLGHTDPSYWTPYGFTTLAVDDLAVQHARRTQRQHGVLGRRRQLHHRVAALEHTLAAARAALVNA